MEWSHMIRQVLYMATRVSTLCCKEPPDAQCLPLPRHHLLPNIIQDLRRHRAQPRDLDVQRHPYLAFRH
jgi:hypothetical protein